jgi:uncharacterized protein affecting Mg2+/Co2+ transport
LLLFSCIGTTPPAPGAMLDNHNTYRFAYRIRIENRSQEHVQLLGRFWNIQELPVEQDGERPEPMVVHAPVTGAGT